MMYRGGNEPYLATIRRIDEYMVNMPSSIQGKPGNKVRHLNKWQSSPDKMMEMVIDDKHADVLSKSPSEFLSSA